MEAPLNRRILPVQVDRVLGRTGAFLRSARMALSTAVIAIFALLAPACELQAPATPDLSALYSAHQWFALRRATADGSGSPLYRGAVAVAFGEAEKAEHLLRGVTAADPRGSSAGEAYDWLTYLYLRDGRFPQAVAAMKAKQRLHPNSAEATDRPLIAAFTGLPEQRTVVSRPAHLRVAIEGGVLVVPLTVNGHRVRFILDTDANLCTMSEAQARALGIAPHHSSAHVYGAGGGTSSFRVASARTLVVGATQLTGVAFQIQSDQSPLFKTLPIGRRGLIGLPVLRALGALTWTLEGEHAGTMEIQPSPGAVNATANICFDGSDPLTEMTFQGAPLPVLFDTGNEVTELWPPFAQRFPNVVSGGKKQTQPVTGFDGSTGLASAQLDSLRFGLGGAQITLSPAPVLLETTTPNSQWYYGRMGIDLMRQAHRIRLDLHALQLSIE